MEYGGTRTLRDLQAEKQAHVFSSEESLKYFAQILNGIKLMHQEKIAHSDIKLENLLIDDEN